MPAVSAAIERGLAFLEAEAGRDFAEARHVMRFPRAAGFAGAVETHAAETFARAVLAGLLVDIADRLPPAASLRAVARREATRVAAARLADRAGGWSYFPTLPELPPDLDSLGAAVALFARAAPELLPLCEEPIALALGQAAADGGIETWLIAPSDAPADRAAMCRGVARHWGRGADVEVCARFYDALALADPGRFGDAIVRGARFVASRQRPDGGWDAAWYWGEAQACDLGLRLLRRAPDAHEPCARAAEFLLGAQRADGGWGAWESVPLDTALAVGALLEAGAPPAPAVARAVAVLLDRQTLTGAWRGTPWIKMDIGRAAGRVTRTATYRSATLTTAFCVRALAAASDPLR
jgi:squalene-hopene/tetraprenyl-beta-curcumene cyclase